MHRNSPFQGRHVPTVHRKSMLSLAVAVGLFSALWAASAVHAADDDYMRGIRSEALKLEQLDRPPATADESIMKPVKDFEAALLLESPESYRLYQQLVAEKRLTVYQHYQQTRDFKSVRRRIIELRLGG